MRKLVLLMSVGVALFATSCNTVSKTGHIAPLAYTEVQPNPIKAELDFNVAQKSTGKATAVYILGCKIAGDRKFAEVKGLEAKSIFGGRVAKIKTAAIYNALDKTDYDMLINPQYDSEIKTYLFGAFKSYNVDVKGYGAKIKDLYQVKD